MNHIEKYKKELETVLKENITKRAERNITYQPRLKFGEALLLLYPTQPTPKQLKVLKKLSVRMNDEIPLRKALRALKIEYKYLVYKNKPNYDVGKDGVPFFTGMLGGTKVAMI